MSESGSVRVAVRIRPFNDREKQMNAKLCLRMEGPTTYITEPETGQEKPFTFDFSYWSHDGFHVDENGEIVGDTEKYATQRNVFDDLGRDVLRSAFDGYNSCLFAYGQTGSGKSYSMVGYGKNRGIIPIVCEEMFKTIAENTDPHIKYEVVVSMLEIYNECVKDLLNPKNNPPGGLKIRSQKDIGVYVEDLLEAPVSSYEEIEAKMAEGTLNRSVASTKMNATSSRAHTVFSIVFCKKRNEMGMTSEVRSRMNLVDLAGSERADSTGATGDRLKEGCAINASLSALGNVISALADIANGKKKVFVPYRNSALTRLLQDALGGNSRTIMICALSPADVNYDETVSTLRYAARAKQIKNKVTKNENPTDKLIQALKEENARLMAMLEGKMPVAQPGEGAGAEAVAEMRRQLEQIQREKEENDKMLASLQMSWEDKLRQAQQQHEKGGADAERVMQAARDLSTVAHPYLLNLHQDPVLNECVMYVLHKDRVTIGRARSDAPGGNGADGPDVLVSGLHIKERHAELLRRRTPEGHVEVVLHASEPQTKLFVNGEVVGVEGVVLQPFDRVLVGNNFLFRFHVPGVAADEASQQWCGADAWSRAQEEYQLRQGLKLQQGGDVAALEKEDGAKTRELERKLREMEATVARQREQQERMLLQQQEVMRSSGLSEEEKRVRLEQLQRQHQQALSSMEAQAERDRAVTVRVMQEQVRKRRQLKQMQQVMGGVTPLVLEANALCEELGKPLKFEAKLVLRPDEGASASGAAALKSIVAVVLVTNTHTQTWWTWDIAKFESRLFLMRDLYQAISEHGPRVIAQTEDPFWDPPEPVHLGRARIVLKALSQCVDVDGDGVITSDTGTQQGAINYELQPVDAVGEPLDYTSSPQDTLGVHLRLRVRLEYAKDLPRQYSNYVRVQCELLGRKLHGAPIPGKGSMCRLNFCETVDLGVVDEALLTQLQSGAALVHVYGFTDAHVAELDTQRRWLRLQADGVVAVDADRAPRITMATVAQLQQGAPVCADSGADPESDVWYTQSSSVIFPVHTPSLSTASSASFRSPSAASAHSTPFITPAPTPTAHALSQTSAAPDMSLVQAGRPSLGTVPEDARADSAGAGASASTCQQCKEAVAVWLCGECGDKAFCQHCFSMMHRAASRKAHVPTPFSLAPYAASPLTSAASPASSLSSPVSLASPRAGTALRSSASYGASPSTSSDFGDSASPSTPLKRPLSAVPATPTTPATPRSGTPLNEVHVSTGSANGRPLYMGPRGGIYYLRPNGKPTYIRKPPQSDPAHTPTSASLCDKCATLQLAFWCESCGKAYCANCDAPMHKASARSEHVRSPVLLSAPTFAGSKCDKCAGDCVTSSCIACEELHCAHCDVMMHKARSRAEHERISLPQRKHVITRATPLPLR